MTITSVSRETSPSSFRIRLGVWALVISGIFFVLYPLIRPFSDEASLQGAQAFASNAWILAHMLAVVAFILLALGLLSLYATLQNTVARNLSFLAFVITWIGVGLTLTYYGAEIYALHAIGQEALKEHSAALLSLVDAVRYGPGVIVFGVGLLLLAIGGILAAIAVWQSGMLSRWTGIPLALGLALYIPQFFGTQPIRVAHGLLVALGCIWLAVSIVRGLKSQQV